MLLEEGIAHSIYPEGWIDGQEDAQTISGVIQKRDEIWDKASPFYPPVRYAVECRVNKLVQSTYKGGKDKVYL